MRKYARILIVVSLSCLLLTAQAFALTQTRRPTGDNSFTGNWSTTGSFFYTEVNEADPPNDATHIYATSDPGSNLFNFSPAFSVPAGATISNLTIYYRAWKNGNPGADIRSTLLVNGTDYDTVDPGVNPSKTVYTDYSYSYTENPDLPPGSPWTVADINGTGSNPLQAFGVNTDDANPNPYVSQVYAIVTYTVLNTPPVLNDGSTEDVLPALSQATDGSGKVTLTFRIKDAQADTCSAVSGTFQYQVDSGGWNNILDADITGTKTGLSSATDLNGTLHTLVWDNSKEYIDDAISQNVQIRFKVNDGTDDGAYGVSPLGFNVDNLDPATLVTTDITSRPNAGESSVVLDCSFTETNPNTNTFYLAINGGAYGAGTPGDSGIADPSAQATAVGATLDGNDYISKVKCDHVDDYGNSGTNEDLSPTYSGVKPYTPSSPTVDNPGSTTLDVTVNKHASEAAGLTYAIKESTTGNYVQAGGNLGVSAVWRTIAAWGTVTVTGLTPPVNSYIFQTRSKNPNGDNPESDLSGGASSTNTAPVLHNGTSEDVLPTLSQATDASGKITIQFRIKDIELDPCSVVSNSFQYQVNGGGWNNILDADITGTKSGLSSAADLGGTLYTLVWDTSKEYIDDAQSADVQMRFNVNDGTVDSADGVSPLGFNVDNLDPAALVTTDISTQPNAGDTTVTLDCSFTEVNPNTNTFYVAVNGGDYGSGTAGDTGTADPSPKAVPVGATLDGNDYVNKVKCEHVDDFGNAGTNENLSPDSVKKYVKPYIPSVPTVNDPAASTVSVRINKHATEASGIEYAIYVSSHAKYVQSNGTLGDSAVWQTITNWGVKTVTGLTPPVSDYYFKTKSRNPSDADNKASSESDLSDPANTTGAPPTSEAVVSYSPGAGAENVSPEVQVSVTFDRDMNTTSIEDVFSMNARYDNSGNIVNLPVSGSFSWSRNRILTFTPSADLTKGYAYRVSIAGNVQDYDGNTLALDLSWTFRVILDRQIQNDFFSADNRARVFLAAGAIGNDASIDINRDPIDNPREVDSNKIITANYKIAAEGDEYLHPIVFFITEINAYGIDDVRITGTFEAPVTVTLYYDEDENNPGIVLGTSPPVLERGLVMCWLDEVNSLWVRIPGSTVNTTMNYVSATVKHFSVYALLATPASSLENAYAFPNPFKPGQGHTAVTFTNLSSDCTIKIFTLTGDLVKTIIENDGDAQATWNVRNEDGEELVSGLYLFVIISADDVKRGKLVIIK